MAISEWPIISLTSFKSLDAHEKPLAMAYVIADNRSTPATEFPLYISAWTGSDGKYTLYLPAGKFYLGVSTIMPPPAEE